jgi:HSP20 family protein
MSLVRWSPVRDLTTFPSDILNVQREINRMFNSFFHGGLSDDTSLMSAAWSPAVDLAEREDDYALNVELPGVSKDDVKITLQDNVLTIRGEKKQEEESKKSNLYRVERSYGSFQRSFTLPTTVEGNKIEASFKDGILTVVLPKAEEVKRKEIEVRVK